MREYRYDHVHLRSSDPDATARFLETMFGAEVTRSVYPTGTLYPGHWDQPIDRSMSWKSPNVF
jgi:hypothetical protein